MIDTDNLALNRDPKQELSEAEANYYAAVERHRRADEALRAVPEFQASLDAQAAVDAARADLTAAQAVAAWLLYDKENEAE